MARYIGPKCKLSRREGTDLFLKSGVTPFEKSVNPSKSRVYTASVVSVFQTTACSFARSKKYVACMAYSKNSSVTTTKKLLA